jgi:hypothetical protein
MRIDWSKIPTRFNWVAMDDNGRVYAYSHKPLRSQIASFWVRDKSLGDASFTKEVTSLVYMNPVHWAESLVERPNNLENFFKL